MNFENMGGYPEKEPKTGSLQEFANQIGLDNAKVEEIKNLIGGGSVVIGIPAEHGIPYHQESEVPNKETEGAIKIVVDLETGKKYKITGEARSFYTKDKGEIQRAKVELIEE